MWVQEFSGFSSGIGFRVWGEGLGLKGLGFTGLGVSEFLCLQRTIMQRGWAY